MNFTLNDHLIGLRYPKILIIDHLIINSVRSKLSETKLDDSFLDSQFFAEGFKMYRKGRSKSGGGRLLYVNENLPGKIISFYKFKESLKIILFEFSVSNKKWLLLNFSLNLFSPIYENFVLLGNFNMSIENPNLKNFICSFDLKSLIDFPTCYKSINPTCINLILTNKKNDFMKSVTFETGLSDHYKTNNNHIKKNYK